MVLGCSYGDKSDWCVTHLQSSSDANVCYYGNEDLCCESCHKYKNSTNIGKLYPYIYELFVMDFGAILSFYGWYIYIFVKWCSSENDENAS